MAHFCGTVQGSRGEVSRLGGKDSGIETYAASWRGAVRVQAYYDEATKTDCAVVCLEPWRGHGTHRELWRGPIDGTKADKS